MLLIYVPFCKYNLDVYHEQWPRTALSWSRGFCKKYLLIYMDGMQHFAMIH